MTPPATAIEMSDLLFEDLEKHFKDVFQDTLVIKYVTSNLGKTLCTADFLISFEYETGIYNISFIVGLEGYLVAKYMMCILSVLEIPEILILSDSYFCSDRKELVFGREAIEAKQKDILLNVGKSKCLMCEYIYPTEIVEEGVCPKCRKNYAQFNWQ